MFGLKKRYSKTSFSQSGEDLLVQFAFKAMGRDKVFYLDIGTHDPVKFNNTYGLYLRGDRGVCVEPNPELNRRIAKVRPGDKCLNVGVAAQAEAGMKFYVVNPSTLSTFSAEEAERLRSYGRNIVETLEIAVISVEELLREHCEQAPDFVSIDCEGMDDVILANFPFDEFRPAMLCIETITYREDGSETKRQEIMDLMQGHGYMVYADTYINTIFIDEAAWRSRPVKQRNKQGNG